MLHARTIYQRGIWRTTWSANGTHHAVKACFMHPKVYFDVGPRKGHNCSMCSTTNSMHCLDRMLDPLAESLTPAAAEKLVRLQADPETQARIDELADKCTEGELTEDERTEYETYVRASDLIAILQAKARALLAKQNGS